MPLNDDVVPLLHFHQTNGSTLAQRLQYEQSSNAGKIIHNVSERFCEFGAAGKVQVWTDAVFRCYRIIRGVRNMATVINECINAPPRGRKAKAS